jgi:hypothetical protein
MGEQCSGRQGSKQEGFGRPWLAQAHAVAECERCQRPRVHANGSGVNSDCVDGVRLYGLHGEAVEHGRDGEGMLCRSHLGSGFCAVGCYGFAPGIPACSEGG